MRLDVMAEVDTRAAAVWGVDVRRPRPVTSPSFPAPRARSSENSLPAGHFWRALAGILISLPPECRLLPEIPEVPPPETSPCHVATLSGVTRLSV